MITRLDDIDSHYVEKLTEASNAMWKVFVSILRQWNPNEPIEVWLEKCKQGDELFRETLRIGWHNTAQRYGERYCSMCRAELLKADPAWVESLRPTSRRIKHWTPPKVWTEDPAAFLKAAKEGNMETWAIFKPAMIQILNDEFHETAWGDISGKLAKIFHEKYEQTSAFTFVRSYMLMCVDELDIIYRNIHGIEDDLAEYMVPLKGKKRKDLPKPSGKGDEFY